MGNRKNYPESDVYVKIDSSDAVQSKKDLLEVTASIINMQMLNEKIKKSGKAEIKQRAEAKAEIKSMNVLLNHLMAELPRLKVQKSEINEIESVQDSSMSPQQSRTGSRIKTIISAKPKKATLNDELLEIKRKLAGLNQ